MEAAPTSEGAATPFATRLVVTPPLMTYRLSIWGSAAVSGASLWLEALATPARSPGEAIAAMLNPAVTRASAQGRRPMRSGGGRCFTSVPFFEGERAERSSAYSGVSARANSNIRLLSTTMAPATDKSIRIRACGTNGLPWTWRLNAPWQKAWSPICALRGQAGLIHSRYWIELQRQYVSARRAVDPAVVPVGARLRQDMAEGACLVETVGGNQKAALRGRVEGPVSRRHRMGL